MSVHEIFDRDCSGSNAYVGNQSLHHSTVGGGVPKELIGAPQVPVIGVPKNFHSNPTVPAAAQEALRRAQDLKGDQLCSEELEGKLLADEMQREKKAQMEAERKNRQLRADQEQRQKEELEKETFLQETLDRNKSTLELMREQGIKNSFGMSKNEEPKHFADYDPELDQPSNLPNQMYALVSFMGPEGFPQKHEFFYFKLWCTCATLDECKKRKNYFRKFNPFGDMFDIFVMPTGHWMRIPPRGDDCAEVNYEGSELQKTMDAHTEELRKAQDEHLRRRQEATDVNPSIKRLEEEAQEKRRFQLAIQEAAAQNLTVDEFWRRNPNWTPPDEVQVDRIQKRGKDGRLQLVEKRRRRQRVKKSNVLTKEDKLRLQQQQAELQQRDGAHLKHGVRQNMREMVETMKNK